MIFMRMSSGWIISTGEPLTWRAQVIRVASAFTACSGLAFLTRPLASDATTQRQEAASVFAIGVQLHTTRAAWKNVLQNKHVWRCEGRPHLEETLASLHVSDGDGILLLGRGRRVRIAKGWQQIAWQTPAEHRRVPPDSMAPTSPKRAGCLQLSCCPAQCTDFNCPDAALNRVAAMKMAHRSEQIAALVCSPPSPLALLAASSLSSHAPIPFGTPGPRMRTQ